jgi:cation diffusion facilitator CzcD-associated flavoprotein CzcO
MPVLLLALHNTLGKCASRFSSRQKPPHPFGPRETRFECRIYKVLDLDHMDIVSVKETSVLAVTETGIRTERGHKEFDVIVLATAFDSMTGSLLLMDIRSANGGTPADRWKDGLRISMGIALEGFPNMFFLYGPQAPTMFTNSPSCTQSQAEFVTEAIRSCREDGITCIEVTTESEEKWTKTCTELWNKKFYLKANG